MAEQKEITIDDAAFQVDPQVASLTARVTELEGQAASDRATLDNERQARVAERDAGQTALLAEKAKVEAATHACDEAKKGVDKLVKAAQWLLIVLGTVRADALGTSAGKSIVQLIRNRFAEALNDMRLSV